MTDATHGMPDRVWIGGQHGRPTTIGDGPLTFRLVVEPNGSTWVEAEYIRVDVIRDRLPLAFGKTQGDFACDMCALGDNCWPKDFRCDFHKAMAALEPAEVTLAAEQPHRGTAVEWATACGYCGA